MGLAFSFSISQFLSDIGKDELIVLTVNRRGVIGPALCVSLVSCSSARIPFTRVKMVNITEKIKEFVCCLRCPKSGFIHFLNVLC